MIAHCDFNSCNVNLQTFHNLTYKSVGFKWSVETPITRPDVPSHSLCETLSHRVRPGVNQSNLEPEKIENLVRVPEKAAFLMKSLTSTYYLRLKGYLKLSDFIDQEFNLPVYRSTSLRFYGKFRFKYFLLAFDRF